MAAAQVLGRQLAETGVVFGDRLSGVEDAHPGADHYERRPVDPATVRVERSTLQQSACREHRLFGELRSGDARPPDGAVDRGVELASTAHVNSSGGRCTTNTTGRSHYVYYSKKRVKSQDLGK